MPVHLTVDRAATWCTDLFLSRQQLTEEREDEIYLATKYNLLVTAFNASTVILVASVAFAIFLSYTASLILLAMGLFVRCTVEKEIRKYTLPPRQDEEEQSPRAAVWERLRTFASSMLRHALHQESAEEQTENIFRNVDLPRPEQWDQDEVFVFDYSFWKNKIEIPPPVGTEGEPLREPRGFFERLFF